MHEILVSMKFHVMWRSWFQSFMLDRLIIYIIGKKEEAEIVECGVWVMGYGLCRSDVTKIVEDFFRVTKRKNHPFKDGVPGYDWWFGFKKCHPQLTERIPQALQIHRAKAATPTTIDHWFNKTLKPTLDQLNLGDRPSQIYNVDESGFPISGRPGKVLAPSGIKSPQCLLAGSGRENVTIQCCVSASASIYNLHRDKANV